MLNIKSNPSLANTLTNTKLLRCLGTSTGISYKIKLSNALDAHYTYIVICIPKSSVRTKLDDQNSKCSLR